MIYIYLLHVNGEKTIQIFYKLITLSKNHKTNSIGIIKHKTLIVKTGQKIISLILLSLMNSKRIQLYLFIKHLR